MIKQTEQIAPVKSSAVDDVRRVREEIANQHAGDLRGHIAETNRIFEQWREKLGVKHPRASPPVSHGRPKAEKE